MRIDVKESIDKGRLIESEISNERRIEIIVSYFFGLGFTFFPLFLFGFIITHTPLTILSTLAGTILLLIGIVSLYGLLFKNRLIRISGTMDPEVNKSLIKDVLKEVFDKNVFIDTGNIWTSRKFDQISIRGKRNNRLTLLFDKDSIYCNGELIGRRDIHSTFHSLYYLIKFIRVRNKFELKVTDWQRQKSNYA